MAVLRVMSYNVHVLRDDLNALARVVRAARPHIVFVQEAAAMWRWQARNASLARRCGLVVFGGGGPVSAGNVIMGSLAVDVDAARTVGLKRLLFHRRRGAVLAACSYLGVPFTAVGAHLSVDEDERALQLHGLLAELPDPPDPPVVFGADMNEQQDGAAWSAAIGRFRDVGACAHPTPTFSCASPHRRIDAIFIDPAISVREYRVLDSPDVRRASDHFPIYAELELPT